MQNALKFLTTERQRNLLRLKADKNVIEYNEYEDKDLLDESLDKLSLAEITNMHGDSTVFESDEFVGFIEKLEKEVVATKLEDKEWQLLKGIKTVHLKSIKRKSATNFQKFK